MSDDWEDWENQDFVIPVLNVPNEEQLKRLEERKLVEDSDNALTKDLFSNEEDLALKQVEIKISVKPLPKAEKKAPNKNIPNKINYEKREKENYMVKQRRMMNI